MKQLKDINGICKYCSGCVKIEEEIFVIYKCKGFDPVIPNWKTLIENELENRRKNI